MPLLFEFDLSQTVAFARFLPRSWRGRAIFCHPHACAQPRPLSADLTVRGPLVRTEAARSRASEHVSGWGPSATEALSKPWKQDSTSFGAKMNSDESTGPPELVPSRPKRFLEEGGGATACWPG